MPNIDDPKKENREPPSVVELGDKLALLHSAIEKEYDKLDRLSYAGKDSSADENTEKLERLNKEIKALHEPILKAVLREAKERLIAKRKAETAQAKQPTIGPHTKAHNDTNRNEPSIQGSLFSSQ